ncbi:MAG: stimulus-sensing domain-containing protein [Holosporaceae bacterium]
MHPLPIRTKRWFKRRWSPLTRRVLAINLLPLLLLLAALFYLDYYQDGLIDTELQALTTQGRVFAGALGEGAVVENSEGEQSLRERQAKALLRRLVSPTTLRVMLFRPDGQMMIDTELLDEAAMGRIIRMPLPKIKPPRPLKNQAKMPASNPAADPSSKSSSEPSADLATPPDSESAHAEASLLSDIQERLHRLFRGGQDFDSYIEHSQPRLEDFAEAAQSMQGEFGRAVRVRDNGELVLSVAVPVQRYHQVVGTLVLIAGGEQIDRALHDIRKDLLLLLGGSLAISVLLSFYLAGTLTQPIRRLALTAERVRHGQRQTMMGGLLKRGDEIGDLARVFEAMTSALWQRITAMERFAADVSHELKNPLNSIRSAFETLQKIQDPAKRRRLTDIIMEDVKRLDRLISDIADSSRLDAELQRRAFEPVEILPLLEQLSERHSASYPNGPFLVLKIEAEEPCIIEGIEGRLLQVLHNLLGNAMSFSPPEGTITITLIDLPDSNRLQLAISDEGPGIPPANLEDIFNRFYTERPASEKFGRHSGLGLSISRQIVEAFGGRIYAENRHATDDAAVIGSRFVIELEKI